MKDFESFEEEKSKTLMKSPDNKKKNNQWDDLLWLLNHTNIPWDDHKLNFSTLIVKFAVESVVGVHS